MQTKAGTATVMEKLKQRAKSLKGELTAIYLAARDPRTPWYAKAMIACVVAYAVSPIDLIPDFIPVLGYLDDLVLLPLGIHLAVKLIPAAVLADARLRAAGSPTMLPTQHSAALAIIVVWLIALIITAILISRALVWESQALIGGA